jgi:cytoskeletal protein CcmA (bactofilin family)
MARHTSETSVLGPATRVTGRVTGSGGLSIEGTIQGDVSVTGPALVAAGAKVDGNIEAESLEVDGAVTGDVTTSGPIAVRSGALIRGELKGSEVSIELGSRVSVRLTTQFDLDLGPQARRHH